MNIKRIVKILILVLIGVCIGMTESNAAIVIKPGTTPHKSISADTAFEYCQNMGAYSSSLGYNTLDPHLTTNADWAAVVYLGVSGYGYIRNSTGNVVTISGSTCYSTTKNATGVMNMGKNKASWIASNFDKSNSYTTKMYDKRNTKYVEILAQPDFNGITDEQNERAPKKGLAIYETSGWFNSSSVPTNVQNNYYVVSRSGFFSFGSTSSYSYTGQNTDLISYRPVIWN